MVAIGGLKYMIDILSGNETLPVLNTNPGQDITTLKKFSEALGQATTTKFSDELYKASDQTWNQLNDDINKLDTAYRAKYGTSVFTSNYETDANKYFSFPGVTRTPQNLGMFFLIEYYQNGTDYIFQRDHRTDFDNKDNVLGRGLDAIKTDAKDISDPSAIWNTKSQVDTLLNELIDPNLVAGHAENVPHTSEYINKLNQFESSEKGGLTEKILSFIRQHPSQFNASSVITAIKNEQKFMSDVAAKWNDPSIGKSILEGDVWGTIGGFFHSGIQWTEQTVVDGADTILDSDLNPVKPFWDLLKDLWKNAGTYIEIFIAVVAVFTLLYLAGQIKYVTS